MGCLVIKVYALQNQINFNRIRWITKFVPKQTNANFMMLAQRNLQHQAFKKIRKFIGVSSIVLWFKINHILPPQNHFYVWVLNSTSWTWIYFSSNWYNTEYIYQTQNMLRMLDFSCMFFFLLRHLVNHDVSFIGPMKTHKNQPTATSEIIVLVFIRTKR